MNVLFVGSQAEIACSTFYLKALKDLGHRVTTFDPKAFEAANSLENTLIRLTKRPNYKRLASIGTSLIRHCETNAFDTVMVIAENFLPDVFDEIRSLRTQAPRFIYHSHDNNFSKGILKPKSFFKTLAKYDRVFTTKSQQVGRYKANGIANALYIPSAFEPAVHRPFPDTHSRFSKRPFELSFVGTYDFSRDRFLDAVGWNHLYIWGNNWSRYRDFRKHQDHITPKAIYLDDYADVVSHTKVSLGLLREEAEDLHTQRTFEIPACGSLQIAPRNDEILSFFDEDKEVVCFDSPEELKDKSHYYLKNEALRNSIARRGYERCLKSRHTYLDRVKTMLASF